MSPLTVPSDGSNDSRTRKLRAPGSWKKCLHMCVPWYEGLFGNHERWSRRESGGVASTASWGGSCASWLKIVATLAPEIRTTDARPCLLITSKLSWCTAIMGAGRRLTVLFMAFNAASQNKSSNKVKLKAKQGVCCVFHVNIWVAASYFLLEPDFSFNLLSSRAFVGTLAIYFVLLVFLELEVKITMPSKLKMNNSMVLWGNKPHQHIAWSFSLFRDPPAVSNECSDSFLLLHGSMLRAYLDYISFHV